MFQCLGCFTLGWGIFFHSLAYTTKVDLISNLSLSKNASCIKYALAYQQFDPNINYAIKNKVNTFVPSKQWFEHKCQNYYEQDEKYNRSHSESKRDLSKCISVEQYDDFIKIYKDSCCHLCGEHFTYDNKPTLDRINNDIGHEFSNCKLACAACNRLRSRSDEKITRLRIRLKKFCCLNNLPMTINDEYEYYSLRQNITGGLSNVLHRLNIKGSTEINRFKFENNKVISFSPKDNDNKSYIQSHVVGIDFNSLYPSSFSSIKHDFNKYHGNIMYMPGSFIQRIEVKDKISRQRCMEIIMSKSRFNSNPKYVFKAEVKLQLPKYKINYFINFPAVFRNIVIKNDRSVIGSYMYDYMKMNDLSSIDKEERKLTQLLDTCNQFMTFSNYYLWFLIDHGLVLTDVKSVSTYTAHTGFNSFVTTFMKKRQDLLSNDASEIKASNTLCNEKFYKISMNGSYGYDGMNTENFSKIKICDADKAHQAIISDTYMNASKLNENTYLVQTQKKSFHCNTCLQESFWTLDNAKFWYLTFYYDFMTKCLDMNRLHVTSLDTDSYYFAVAGCIEEDPSQGFKHIIKNKDFYDKNIYKFMPNPSLNSIYDSKKILGCCVEKYGQNQIALCAKCYTIFNDDESNVVALKLKGVSLKKNKITSKDYENVIANNTVIAGKNINLQFKNNMMSKLTVNKNALTGTHTKMICLSNQACAPYVHGLNADDYIVLE